MAVRASRVDEHLVVAASDTGAGIPADALETIFAEFRQVEGSDPQHRDTRLGLPICKGSAELLSGSISVQSEVGKGSTFTVRVPVVCRAGWVGETELQKAASSTTAALPEDGGAAFFYSRFQREVPSSAGVVWRPDPNRDTPPRSG